MSSEECHPGALGTIDRGSSDDTNLKVEKNEEEKGVDKGRGTGEEGRENQREREGRSLLPGCSPGPVQSCMEPSLVNV